MDGVVGKIIANQLRNTIGDHSHINYCDCQFDYSMTN
jgi:hypothetical protein